MRSVKLMLLGIVLLLFGICAILLAGLEGMPTFDNGIYQLLGVLCPIAGVVLAAAGFLQRDGGSR